MGLVMNLVTGLVITAKWSDIGRPSSCNRNWHLFFLFELWYYNVRKYAFDDDDNDYDIRLTAVYRYKRDTYFH